ncbi:MAG: DUF378 domain-containing protein [Clostridia bacterium]|nr:DUF378 domain-containing protein [Clostridia bacterium]MDD4376157.1 DUF378 domain-containing protein [Clostridia bacterium]
MKTIHYIALTLLIIGAINWGLIGLFDFNLVSMLVGEMRMIENIVYVLVALSGLWAITFYQRLDEDRV